MKTTKDLCIGLLQRMCEEDEKVFVRIVRRNEEDEVIAAACLPVSYVKTDNGNSQCICIEESQIEWGEP